MRRTSAAAAGASAIGYYKFRAFDDETEAGVRRSTSPDGDGVIEPGEQILMPVERVLTTVPEGDQWSVGLKANYAGFAFGVTYTS